MTTIPKEPGTFRIKVDDHLIAKISQHVSGWWFLYDTEGYPMAQARSYLAIREHALELIGD